jgi:hypothetical protein
MAQDPPGTGPLIEQRVAEIQSDRDASFANSSNDDFAALPNGVFAPDPL